MQIHVAGIGLVQGSIASRSDLHDQYMALGSRLGLGLGLGLGLRLGGSQALSVAYYDPLSCWTVLPNTTLHQTWYRLSSMRLAHLNAAFDFFDLDGDGQLDAEEFYQIGQVSMLGTTTALCRAMRLLLLGCCSSLGYAVFSLCE